VKREDRAGLILEILEGLARLHADTDFGAGDEAHEIAVHMLSGLAAGETKVGLEPERVRRMRQLMLGARPGADRPAQVRSISILLRSVAGAFGNNKETAIVMAKRMLASVDARLASAERSVALEVIRKLSSGGSTSGAIADLLLNTGALDTPPSHGRDAIQKRLDKTLNAKSKSFNWEPRTFRPFTAKPRERAR
jgi:hypothetical protein